MNTPHGSATDALGNVSDESRRLRFGEWRNMNRSILCAAAVLMGSVVLAAGQNPTMLGHPEDYPRVEVAHGARLYIEHCDRCHGPDGNGISGVDLRSGKF